MYKAGYTFDVGFGAYNANVASTATTGKRVYVRDCQNINFLVFLSAASTGTEDAVFTLNQHTAVSSGTTTALVADHYWVKAAATMDGTETWTKVTNAATDGTITLAGATYATDEAIVLIEVNTKDLKDTTYGWVSLSLADVGSNARVCAILAVPADLQIRRGLTNMKATTR